VTRVTLQRGARHKRSERMGRVILKIPTAKTQEIRLEGPLREVSVP